VLSIGRERSGSYLAQDRFTGSLEGRSGTFVVHHGGWQGGSRPDLFGVIVPGSGSAELEGIRGTVHFPHDPARPGLTMIDYELPERQRTSSD
jgi:hypothetical protein